MSTIAIYAPEHREMDLSALSPRDYETVKGLHGLIKRGDGILLCKRADGDREMFVRRSDGNYFACHFKGGGHGDHAIRRMTPEHLRSVDCWLSAWSAAGYEAAAEVHTSNQLRLDAVAFGPRITGLEVQVQPQAPALVKARHTRRLRATALTGQHERTLSRPMEVVWFAPVGRPSWLYEVPSIECGNRSWEVTPKPTEVAAIGVLRIDIKPCIPTWFSGCPGPSRRGQTWCGRSHPWTEPRERLSIADLAPMITEEQLVPTDIPGIGVHYAGLADRARYEQFAAETMPTVPLGRRRSRPASPTACDWAGHSRQTAAVEVPARHEVAAPGTSSRMPDPSAWCACASCGRRYRPAHPSGKCYDCRASAHRPDHIGPCTRCQLPCIRYGPSGQPLCIACQGPAAHELT